MIDLDKEAIVIEVRDLIGNIETAKDEINVYCELVKQMFLSASGKN